MSSVHILKCDGCGERVEGGNVWPPGKKTPQNVGWVHAELLLRNSENQDVHLNADYCSIACMAKYVHPESFKRL